MRTIIFFLITVCLLIICHASYAAGVEDLLVDFSDYISSKLIPAASIVGVGTGAVVWGFGSPLGWQIIKYSIIGGIVGTAGAETLQALFF
ncbi:hypothetical protein KJ708_11720 [bacterium]|nr:hypothetical protein [bacterium]MBU1918338.1 hypothetical protein [bacterium]